MSKRDMACFVSESPEVMTHPSSVSPTEVLDSRGFSFFLIKTVGGRCEFLQWRWCANINYHTITHTYTLVLKKSLPSLHSQAKVSRENHIGITVFSNHPSLPLLLNSTTDAPVNASMNKTFYFFHFNICYI